MCGICGFVGNNSQSVLERMTDIMSHRGPDDRGFYRDSDVGLGHRRLSIIDLKTGHQPIFNEEESLVLVYNGEIYNFKELRKELLKTGHVFKTNSDSEVIIHLYEEYGKNCVDYLRGMFAFAIWDKKKKELFLARDRFGIKPLYYTELHSGEFLFASEIKSLLQNDKIVREVDIEAFDQYFTFRYVPENKTMFKNIYKLEPGHILIRKNKKFKIEQYWDIEFGDDESSKSEADIVEDITALLTDSIEKRLISDVPLGAYLSGGLDSSFMVGLMSKLNHSPVETFSIGFDDGKLDESKYAEIVAKHFNTIHHQLIAKSNSVELLEKVIWHLDEPMADAATIPTYMMSELTKDFVKVVLSGEGADEVFAGYDKYKILTIGQKYSSLIPSKIFSFLSSVQRRNIKLLRICEYLSSCSEPADAYLKLTSVFSDREKDLLYSDETKRKLGNSKTSIKIVKKYITKNDDFLNNLLYLDIKTWLPNDVLLKNDKMTMANSIEARVPFLDHIFTEEMAKIPVSMKLNGLTDKYILRKAMLPVVPEAIVKRKKHGFTVPIQRWMEGDLLDFSRNVLSKKNIEEKGFFNYKSVESLLNKNHNNAFYRRQFWSILTFELWHQIFIEGKSVN